MTICIATICDSGNTIVLAGDKEVGVGFTSAEFPGSKFGKLYPNWSVGIAGTIANAVDVYTATGRHSIPANSSYNVRSAIEAAYREARLHQAEAKFLGNRGWTMQEFINNGMAKLPSATYANIDAQIAFFDFNADLIVAGFGDGEMPSILTIANPGVCLDHTKLGFWCVGSGSTAAQMSLFSRSYAADMPAEMAAYYAFEAKMNAQHATGVGSATDIFLLRRDKAHTIISDKTIDALNEIWEELKPRSFDTGHLTKLQMRQEFAEFRKA